MFKDVLKIKKQLLDKAELALKAAKARLKAAQDNKSSIEKDLASLRSQVATSHQELSAREYLLKSAGEQLKSAQEALSLSLKECAHYEHLYKLANIEHEKILYLRQEEQQRALAELARKEALELDEIATQRWAQQNGPAK